MPLPERRVLYLGIGLIVLINGLHAAWLLVGSPGASDRVPLEAFIQTLTPFAALPLCFGFIGWRRHAVGDGARADTEGGRRVPRLVGGGLISYGFGQLLHDAAVLRHDAVLGPLSLIMQLAAFAFWILAFFYLPAQPLSPLARTRIVLDSVATIVAIGVCYWYIALGPLALHLAPGRRLTVSVSGPLLTLVMILCLLIVSSQIDPRFNRAVMIYASSMICVLAANVFYDYQTLHSLGNYHYLINDGRLMGIMLGAWGAYAVRLTVGEATVYAPGSGDSGGAWSYSVVMPMPRLWRVMLPYLLVSIVIVLVLHARMVHSPASLQAVLFGGATVIVALILARQIVSLLEMRGLYQRLAVSNEETVLRARHLEHLNDELRAMHNDNEALARLNERFETMAKTDALTGLPNRTLLHDRLHATLEVSRRDGSPCALLLMDLNGFKEVNDSLGHHVGDQLLQQVSMRLREALRVSDTVARLGGDEFALLLPQTDVQGASATAKALLRLLARPFACDERELSVGASIGVAVHPEHGSLPDALLRLADVAMYVAKRSGSGFSVYESKHDHNNPQHLTLKANLLPALAAGELVLHYQPQIDCMDGAIIGAEALLRWPHPTYGLVPPEVFIPLAEQSGLINQVTHWVTTEALKQIRLWARHGLIPSVSINVSARVLHDMQFPETLATLLRQQAVIASQITIEITESAFMTDPGRAREVLERLVALGVRISIDDFGTGYSSLGYLKQLPVHEVKIDKSFVLHMQDDPKDAALVRSIIAMAHALGLTVVAEGVETAAAWTTLRAAGCDIVQGYYLGRPVAAGEIERRLRTGTRAA